MCADKRCTDGITACMGGNGCNGWGVMSPGGRKYRQRRGTPPGYSWSVRHHECNGTGQRVCGCRKLTPEQRADLKGTPWGRNASGEPEERWSSHTGHLITKPKRVRKPKPAPTEPANATTNRAPGAVPSVLVQSVKPAA
ncbi:hypothetical protein BJF78_30140 [Pseudonocardia sp. CNS-139]|nr:hypothetical protein BJF78_30140 [Pseudonocardia sp. CNS-139]